LEMSDTKPKTDERARRRSSIALGRRSVPNDGNREEEDEEQKPQANEGKRAEILRYENYKETLVREAERWKKIRTSQENKIETARKGLEEPFTQKECRISLATQNFLDARPDYDKFLRRSGRYDQSTASYAAENIELSTLLSETQEMGHRAIQRTWREKAAAVLRTQRPVKEIIAELATLK